MLGGAWSFTVIDWVQVALAPQASVARKVRVMVKRFAQV